LNFLTTYPWKPVQHKFSNTYITIVFTFDCRNRYIRSISNKHLLHVFDLLWIYKWSRTKIHKLEYYLHIYEAHRKISYRNRLVWRSEEHWQQVLSEFKLLQTLILCVHKCKRFRIYFKVEFTLGANTTISVLLLEPEPWETKF